MKKKECLWTQTAGMLTGARRVAMMLLTTLLLTITAQTAWAQGGSITGTVKVSVIDAANGDEIEGATMQVLDSEENFVEGWVSGTGIHVIEGLNTGEEYTLRETVAPQGYTIDADIIFTIDETGKVTTTGTITEEGVLLVENSITHVAVSVVDIATGEEVEGATMLVLDSEENFVEGWDSFTGIHVIEGLKTGEEYTLRETVAPDGYTIAKDIIFTIAKNGKVTSTGSITEDGVLLVKNSKTHVAVSAVDVATGEEVEGATMLVLDSEENFVEGWVSGTEIHVIEGLKTGEEYTLRETVAPQGYTIAEDIIFTIDKNGKVTTTGTITEEGVLLVENSITHVEISVVDTATGEEVEGATMLVLDSEENFVEGWDSFTGIFVIEGLKTGEEYTLRETVAPDGYTIAEDIIFTIDENGKVTSTGSITEEGVLLVENIKTHVAVSAVDVANGDEVEGATVQVLDSEGDIVEEWVSGTEIHVIEGLNTGEEYTLRETVAPQGYTIAEDIIFTIDENGKVTSTGTITEEGVLLVENIKTHDPDVATDIKFSRTTDADGTEQWYDLNGRPITKPATKGIYIHNGRKEAVK